MSKRSHPIQRLRRALWKSYPTTSIVEEEIIARHVKPLLDMLERIHHGHHVEPEVCKVCRLLDEWRRKP